MSGNYLRSVSVFFATSASRNLNHGPVALETTRLLGRKALVEVYGFSQSMNSICTVSRIVVLMRFGSGMMLNQPKTSFEEDQFEALNYYDAQQLFFEHYHTTNPVYRALPKECNPTLLVEVADADEKAMTKISEPTLKEAAKFEEVSVDIQEDDLQGRGMSLPEISQSLSTPAFARRAVSIVNTNRIHELLHEVRKQLSSLKKRMLQAYAHWFCRLTKHL
eukprot:GHVT01032223.1.p1 GENE.GHVT01032223.1~~GHVT01032223.1.p1  ORF type:complete len:220 (-),score=9.09 GHVT01032223.1:1189-1848(-)